MRQILGYCPARTVDSQPNLTTTPPCLQDALSDGIAQPDTAKRQALPCSNGHSNSPPTAHERHLSPYAVQQLLASGVSPQLLQQIQAAPCNTPQAPCRPANAPLVKPSSKGNSKHSSRAVESLSVGTPKGSSSPKSSSRAAFRKAAHLLRNRQEDILKRVTCLETGQARLRCMASDKAREAGLKWQTLAPKLQVWSTALLGHEARLQCLLCALCSTVRHKQCIMQPLILSFDFRHYFWSYHASYSLVAAPCMWAPLCISVCTAHIVPFCQGTLPQHGSLFPCQMPLSTVDHCVQGLSAGALNRWGHSTTLYEDKLVVFGG